jgi:hypothetical protein
VCSQNNTKIWDVLLGKIDTYIKIVQESSLITWGNSESVN